MFTPYSWITYNGDGTTDTFGVPFPYVAREHVHVYIGWDPSTRTFSTELVHDVDFTYASGTSIATTVAPATGTTITLLRETPIDEPLAEWQTGSPPTARELTTADLQVLYATQEYIDRTAQARADLDQAVFVAAQTVLIDNLNATLATAGLTANQGRVLRELIEAESLTTQGLIEAERVFTQTGVGAIPTTIAAKLQERVSVKDFGAVGDGVADDTAAFTAALKAGRGVSVPRGIYRLTSTITLDQVGHALVGAGRTTTLTGDHTSGPVIAITARQCCLQDLAINSSNTRQAYTTGATYDLAAGLHGVQVYNPAAQLTQCLFDGISVSRQPSHGWYSGGGGTGTIYRQCTAVANRGHGFLFDDRTELGGASYRNGITDLLSCLIVDNGGNAVNLSPNGSTCYRFRLINCEAFNNAWNTSIPLLENSQLYIKGQNHSIESCAVSDQLGATKTTIVSTGDARLAKTTLSRGVYVGTSSDNIFLNNTRFISVDRGVVTGNSLGYLFINGAYFSNRNPTGNPADESDVPVGFQIGSDCLKPVIQVCDNSPVTTMVTSNSLAAPPLVAKKLLLSSFSIPTTGDYHTITGMEETVFLGKGAYRFTCAATVENGSTANPKYSLGVLLTDSLSATSRPPHGCFKSFGANYFDTLALDFIHTIDTSDTYTISLQVRQNSGNFGTVLAANNTFGNTAFFVERLL